MKIGVPSEIRRGERRVALVPDVVRALIGDHHEVVVQAGAGAGALIPDSAYADAGATLTEDNVPVFAAEVVVKVAAPTLDEITRLQPESVLIGFLQPHTDAQGMQALADAGVTSFAMEAIPRITRAQGMDALSSQACIAGYRAALIAATELGRYVPMLTTAAGTIRPATALVLGAGVAGLQALATMRRLGARLQGYDVRAAVRQQVESVGATFLELDLGEDLEGEGGYAKGLSSAQEVRQQELLAEAIGAVDVVITTAQVPGRTAPVLVTEEAVRSMRPGSVIVDLAGESGGNCALSRPGEVIVRHDVTITAPLNLPASMPQDASRVYAHNIRAFLDLMVADGQLRLDFDDEVISTACVTHLGHARGVAAQGLARSEREMS